MAPTLQLRKARDTQTHIGTCTHTSKVALKGWQLSRMYRSVIILRRFFLKWNLLQRKQRKNKVFKFWKGNSTGCVWQIGFVRYNSGKPERLSSLKKPPSFANPLPSPLLPCCYKQLFTKKFPAVIGSYQWLVWYFMSRCFLSELGYRLRNTEAISQLRDPG